MTAQELINIVPFEILQRGQQYYDNGNITRLKEGKNGTWYAEVSGNYGNYIVEVTIDNDSESADYFCDCPYEGSICKHVAAVALAINDKKTVTISPKEDETWEQLIKKAKLKDLRNFMLEYGAKNQDFCHQIELSFSKPESVDNVDNIDYYTNLISGIFENYDYDGYIDYRSGRKAMNDVHEFLHKADNYYKKGNLNEVFSICAAIAIEAVKALKYMDDSSGECGGAIYSSIQKIEDVFSKTTSKELRERIFTWLHEQVQNKSYNDYGVGDDIEPLFFRIAKSLQKIDIAYSFLDAQIAQLEKGDAWDKKYRLQNCLQVKINLLQDEGRTNEVDVIIDSYLHFEEFRKIRVEQALMEKHNDKAEKLILEGISIAQKDSAPGIVHQWKDQLLHLYKQQQNTPKYNKLARELFIDYTSDINYFKAFKKSTPKENWEKECDTLITELKKQKRRFYTGTNVDDLAGIYIEEQMIDELFDIIITSNSIETIIKYTKHLQEKFPSDLIEYYKAAIEIKAEQTGRSVYVALVEYLKKMAKLKGGLPVAKALMKSLLQSYKNRPAMKEEFKKLNWTV